MRQHLPIRLAVVLRIAVVAAHPIRGDAPVWRRANLPAARWRLTRRLARQSRVWREQEPAVRDRDDGLALVAQPAQVPRQVFQSVEHPLLAPALNHLVGNPGIEIFRLRDLRVVVGGHGALPGGAALGKALEITLLDRILRIQPAALPPEPVLGRVPLHRRRPPRQRQVARRHSGVITANRSSSPTMRSSSLTSGRWMRCDAGMSVK